MDRHTIPTRLTPAMIERYTASGHWRSDTIYALRAHAERAPDSFAVRDSVRRPHLSRACRRRRCAGGGPGAARCRARPARRGVAAEPGRERGRAARLLAQRHVCCPSLHRDHTVGEVVELMQRTQRGGADRAGRLRRRCRQARFDRRAEGGSDVEACLSAGAAFCAEHPPFAGIGAARLRSTALKSDPNKSSISPSPPARRASRRA